MKWVPYGFRVMGPNEKPMLAKYVGSLRDTNLLSRHRLQKGHIVWVPYSFSNISLTLENEPAGTHLKFKYNTILSDFDVTVHF